MRNLSKTKSAIKNVEKLIDMRHFYEDGCCAIGALALKTKNENLVNALKKHNTTGIFSQNLNDIAEILEKEYSLSRTELIKIQDINDKHMKESRKSEILRYLEKLESETND